MIKAVKSLPKILRKLSGKKGNPRGYFNSAIIVAAGNGTRANTGKVTKQMTFIGGIPVIVRTVNVFEKCGFINEIIIVAREDEIPAYEKFTSDYNWKKAVRIVKGGETRQQSVLEGFKAISDKSEFVYIHDGARCLVTAEMIENVGIQACIHGAAIAAVLSGDTVKRSDMDMKVAENIDRKTVYLAQTPQVFKTELYRASAYTALKNGIDVTDDSMLAEAAGFPVKLVDCGRENIKLTMPVDFVIAEAILRYREEKG